MRLIPVLFIALCAGCASDNYPNIRLLLERPSDSYTCGPDTTAVDSSFWEPPYTRCIFHRPGFTEVFTLDSDGVTISVAASSGVSTSGSRRERDDAFAQVVEHIEMRFGHATRCDVNVTLGGDSTTAGITVAGLAATWEPGDSTQIVAKMTPATATPPAHGLPRSWVLSVHARRGPLDESTWVDCGEDGVESETDEPAEV